jgi:hypothetical protein
MSLWWPLMFLFDISYGFIGCIRQDDSWLATWQDIGYSWYRCPTHLFDGLFGSFGQTYVLHIGSGSNFQSIQVDGSLLLQISSFICIFLSMGMHVWLIFEARLLRSLWDFCCWIPGEKLQSLDYSLDHTFRDTHLGWLSLKYRGTPTEVTVVGDHSL